MERIFITGRILLLTIFFGIHVETVQGSRVNVDDENVDYVEFRLLMGRTDFGAIRTICMGDSVFVNLPDMMQALGYSCEWAAEQNRFSTCCPTPQDCFSIHQDSLLRGDSCSSLSKDQLLYDGETLYLFYDSYQRVCGLQLRLFFQSFRLYVSNAIEYPKVKLERLEKLRDRAFGQRGDLLLQNVDTLPLNLMKFTSLGYSLSTNIDNKGLQGYSGVLSGNGEFMKGALNLNYSRSQASIDVNDQLMFKLNYKLNKNNLKQLTFFRDHSSFTLDLGEFTNGVYVSNDDNTFFDQRYYVYRGQTRPNANVEIYNNQAMVAYISANAKGEYEARIPVRGGSNTISARTLNEYGESLTEQKTIYIPLNLQRKGEIHYSVTSGYADVGKSFLGAYGAYGITDKLTATVMTESTLEPALFKTIVGVGLQFAPQEWLQLEGNYTPGVKYKVNATGSLSSYLGYSLEYEQFRKNQTQISFAPMRVFRLDMSTTLPLRKLRNTLTYSMYRTEHATFKQYVSTLRWNVSRGSLHGRAFVTGTSQHSFRPSNYSFGANIGFYLNRQLYNTFTYSHAVSRKDHQLSNRVQYRLAKRLSAVAEVQYQTQGKNLSIQLGVSYRFPWMTVGGNARIDKNNWMLNTTVSGGVDFYGKGVLHFSNQAQGGATLCVVLFVDRNGNKRYDKGEKVVQKPKVKLHTAGELTHSKNGSYFRNIPANYAFQMSIPKQTLEDISWQVTPVDTAFCLAPNQSHTVYFPVRVLSEVSGEVYCVKKGKRVYKRNVIIGIIPANGGKTIRVRTDEWGFYEYMGLSPGAYRLVVLSSGVEVKGKTEIAFVIPECDEGQLVERQDFELELKE